MTAMNPSATAVFEAAEERLRAVGILSRVYHESDMVVLERFITLSVIKQRCYTSANPTTAVTLASQFVKAVTALDDIDPTPIINYLTAVFVNQVPPSGVIELQVADRVKMGPTTPWFTIKEIVGDNVFVTYQKQTAVLDLTVVTRISRVGITTGFDNKVIYTGSTTFCKV